jgi:alpha-D-ribose 1-methylphosphonate 5-phosphate C-P lyase
LANAHQLTDENHKFIIQSDNESDGKRDKYISFLNSIVMDENLKRMFSCLCTTKTTLEKELESSLAQMKKLSESIDLGHTIKGKCDLGY